MLGKQWLNRYASTDMRGSAIERSQSRQRKLDGIVRWYFDTVLESLPLMLQVALLLLGCALSRYLWGISLAIALVVLGVTSIGLLFYFFIIIVGTIWESCPYQTPGSHFLRYLGPKISKIAQLATSFLGKSEVINTITVNTVHYHPWWSEGNTAPFLKDLLHEIPPALARDAYRLGRAAIQVFGAPLAMSYRLVRRGYSRLHGSPPAPEHRLDNQATVLDFRCISWTLQTSLDKPVRLSALEYLVTIMQFTSFDSTLIVDCFNIFIGCIIVSNDRVVIIQGLEQLATAAARWFLQTLRHLSATRLTSSVLVDLLRRYNWVFPSKPDFRGLPFYHTMVNIHTLASERPWNPRCVQWTDYRPSNPELIPFARHMVDAARAEYQQTRNERMPRWILRFSLHFLSQNPPSPTSVIADCLTIIAIALDINLPGVPVSDERYVRSV